MFMKRRTSVTPDSSVRSSKTSVESAFFECVAPHARKGHAGDTWDTEQRLRKLEALVFQDRDERHDLINMYQTLRDALEKLKLMQSEDRTILTTLQEDGARKNRTSKESAPLEKTVSDMRRVVSAMQGEINDVIEECNNLSTLHTDLSPLREQLQELQRTSDRSELVSETVLELRQRLQDLDEAIDTRFQEFEGNLDHRQSQLVQDLKTCCDESWGSIAHDLALLARGDVRDEQALKTSTWHSDKVHGARESQSAADSHIDKIITFEVPCTYELKHNVWDASLMVCCSSLNWTDNVMLVIALLLNTLLQVSFCYIVCTLPESTNDYTEEIVAASQVWRAEVPYNRWRSVCDVDDSLSSNYFQLSTHDEAQSYLTTLMFGTFQQGPLLCIMVITVWTLNVAQVIREALDFCMAVYQEHKYDSTATCLQKHSTTRFTLHDIPTRRVLWAWILAAVQLSVACILLIYGSLWLVATTEMSDLVLNAVALGYITQIDEVMFSTVIPRPVRVLVQRMEPLKRYRRNIPVTGMFLWTGVIVFCIAIGVFQLKPHTMRVWEIEQALCG